MTRSKKSPRFIFVCLMLQQILLGVVAVLWIAGMDLVTPAQVAVTASGVFWGLALAGLLIALVLLADVALPNYMRRLNDSVVALWRQIGIQLTPNLIVCLSLGAGIGEELLFRGALQGTLAALAGPWVAVVVASIVFGLLHAASVAYFLAATVIGAVLGAAYYLTGSLLAVVVAHAVYDIWALNRLAKLLPRRKNEAVQPE